MRAKMKRAKLKQEELKYEVMGILFLALALFTLISLFKQSGILGDFIFKILTIATGEKGIFIIPSLLIFFGISFCWNRKPFTLNSQLGGFFLLLFVILVTIHLFPSQSLPNQKNFSLLWETGLKGQGGGFFGAILGILMIFLFGGTGTLIVLITLYSMAFILLTGIPLSRFLKSISIGFSKGFRFIKQKTLNFLFVEEEVDQEGDSEEKRKKDNFSPGPVIIDHNTLGLTAKEETDLVEQPSHAVLEVENQVASSHIPDYTLPPLDLLTRSLKVKSSRLNKEILENVRILEETLENFGIKVSVSQVHRGPAITRYEIQLAPGIKVSKIMQLTEDIALSLAASHIRIEAPIPGKAALGIEVPNKEVVPVFLREILESNEFQEATSKLTIALGKDIAGNPVVADLTKMPHLLLAGATGSGKSVCLGAIICSILYKAMPNEVKFLLIDPKVVELRMYNGIPHLLTPVVTDSKKAASTLKWIVNEMENRYKLFASLGVRDIIRYNTQFRNHEQKQYQPLPYIVVVIDELADLMMTAPVDVEDAICRLAQMARAAGIHLVVATHRPSVDVITGVIKANIPSRIAFAVSSQTDSRTIFDLNGAEKLLGKGDMLFLPVGAVKPIRIQGAFVTDHEIEEIVNYIKKQGDPLYLSDFPETVESLAPEEDYGDSLFQEAAKLVMEMGHASVSLLQRRLRIGYTRAARLMDILEEKGIVGPFEGTKPRGVLMTPEQFYRYYGR